MKLLIHLHVPLVSMASCQRRRRHDQLRPRPLCSDWSPLPPLQMQHTFDKLPGFKDIQVLGIR